MRVFRLRRESLTRVPFISHHSPPAQTGTVLFVWALSGRPAIFYFLEAHGFIFFARLVHHATESMWLSPLRIEHLAQDGRANIAIKVPQKQQE